MSAKLNQEDYRKAVSFTYDYFDKAKTGQVNKQQFIDMVGAVSQKLNFPVTEEVIDNAFRRLDTQNKGWISANELHGVLQRYYYN